MIVNLKSGGKDPQRFSKEDLSSEAGANLNIQEISELWEKRNGDMVPMMRRSLLTMLVMVVVRRKRNTSSMVLIVMVVGQW